MGANDDDVFSGQLKIMANMGFPDATLNRRALLQAEGRIYAAVDLIVSGNVKETPATSSGNAGSKDAFDMTAFDPLANRTGSSASLGTRSSRSNLSSQSSLADPPVIKYKPLSPDKQHLIVQLHQMGFRNEGKARNALTLSKWKVEEAVEILLEREKDLDVYFDAINKPSSSTPSTSFNGRGSAPAGFSGGHTGAEEGSPFNDLASLSSAFTNLNTQTSGSARNVSWQSRPSYASPPSSFDSHVPQSAAQFPSIIPGPSILKPTGINLGSPAYNAPMTNQQPFHQQQNQFYQPPQQQQQQEPLTPGQDPFADPFADPPEFNQR
ncbi:hypothetical protein DFS34DRAFT_613151 [Phlyctochytrium arcticum]|nr:hypothetical protein DFS34DRAFT_613151 [Phlyctochytrium arcticum]